MGAMGAHAGDPPYGQKVVGRCPQVAHGNFAMSFFSNSKIGQFLPSVWFKATVHYTAKMYSKNYKHVICK